MSNTKDALFEFTLTTAGSSHAIGAYDISPSQYSRICEILNEVDIQSTPTDTRSTFSGAADYDQTTPFNGVAGEAE